MNVTLAFVATVAAVLVTGSLVRRWDEARHLRFTDESGSHRAVLALAGFEGRRLALHPAWLITLGFVGALTVFFSSLDDPTLSAGSIEPFTYIGLPLGGLALVVSGHRLGTRARRNGLDELEAATPTAPRARTASLLISCLGPVPVAWAYLAAVTVAVGLVVPRPGPLSAGALLSLSEFWVTATGGAVVGVLLSRWLTPAAAPVIGIVAILFLNNGPDHLHPRFRWLRPAVELDVGGTFDIRPEGWHLVFVTGLLALGACLALWRHPPRIALVVATGVAVAVIGSVGWSMTRPPSPTRVAAVVDRLEDPEAHQRCDTRSGTRFCTYPGAESWVDDWAAAVEGVLAQVPQGHRPTDLEVVQREPVRPWTYLAEVEAALDPEVAWAADGAIHPSLSLETAEPDLTVAWQTAAVAVGLPPSVDWRHPSGCMAGGQARQVLSYLLAARATPTAAAGFRSKLRWVRDESKQFVPVPADTTWDYSGDTSGALGREVPARAWLAADGVSRREYEPVAGASGWGSDVLAAAALLDADRDRVDALVATRWDDLVDPSTTTEDFLGWADLSPGTAAKPSLPRGHPRSCP